MADKELTAVVDWPSAPLTNSLVLTSLSALQTIVRTVASTPPDFAGKLLQWSTYDSIDHSLTLERPQSVLSSSYTIRKSLIRKHFLAHTIRSYITKNPSSSLVTAVPRSWEIEIAFADELNEMWTDELYDLGQFLDGSDNSWCILKPGMADRGMGIRLFWSRDTLQQIFEEFDQEATDDEDQVHTTAVVSSQLRHFVIQEYLPNPMLLDPGEANFHTVLHPQGYKFHLRAYVVASGALSLYLYTRVLALFSAVPYVHPSKDRLNFDLAPHLTNTCLQSNCGEPKVCLLEELQGCQIFPAVDACDRLTEDNIQEIVNQMSDILSETFKAALQNPVHFQPLPNAFELFGVDFLVTRSPSLPLQVHLLELNAEPAIELTGPRLTWILGDLFKSIGQVIVDPFFGRGAPIDQWNVGESRNSLRKCLEAEVRGEGGW